MCPLASKALVCSHVRGTVASSAFSNVPLTQGRCQNASRTVVGTAEITPTTVVSFSRSPSRSIYLLSTQQTVVISRKVD